MHVHATSQHYQELDCLGDEIAELSAHLDAATARLLDLIREFDARGGWNSGFSSCAAWLSWRVGLGNARRAPRDPSPDAAPSPRPGREHRPAAGPWSAFPRKRFRSSVFSGRASRVQPPGPAQVALPLHVDAPA